MVARKDKGKLIKWNDDRGFGFIKPNEGGKEVFLHISEMKTTGRRPKIGDVVFYTLGTGGNGKICATSVSIQGVESTSPSSQRNKAVSTNHRRSESVFPKLLTGIAIMATIAIAQNQFSRLFNRPSSLASAPIVVNKPDLKEGCNIKGNISVSTGDKLYHVAGMEDYEGTTITPSKGERWFCSESEAIAAGWRKAPR
ncbi:MAG: cold shock domain-containing protein [Pseudanabaena sp. ELA748]